MHVANELRSTTRININDFESQVLVLLKLEGHSEVRIKIRVEIILHDLSLTKECPLFGMLIKCVEMDLRVALGEDVEVLEVPA